MSDGEHAIEVMAESSVRVIQSFIDAGITLEDVYNSLPFLIVLSSESVPDENLNAYLLSLMNTSIVLRGVIRGD